MYNGVGLPTARGTGTSGYIQRNLSQPKKDTKSFYNYETSPESSRPERDLDPELEKHIRNRKIEEECMRLQDSLEEDPANTPEQIAFKVQELRARLKKGQVDLDLERATDSHRMDMLKHERMDKMHRALHIRKDAREARSLPPSLARSPPMLYCSGPVHTYGLSGNDQYQRVDNVRSFQSPDFLFVAVMTKNAVYVWSLKPACLVGCLLRDAPSIDALGINAGFCWHGESRIFVVCTANGTLLSHCLRPISSAFFPAPTGQPEEVDFAAALLPSFGLHQVKSLNFEICALDSLPTGYVNIKDMTFIKNSLLLVLDSNQGQLMRISINAMTKLQAENVVILFPPTKVLKIEYYELVDMVIWLDEHGKLYRKTNASQSMEGWNGKEIVLGLPDNQVGMCTDFSLNLKYKILSVWFSKEQTICSFRITTTVEPLWSLARPDLLLQSLKWSVSFSYLLATYKCGRFEVISFLGDQLIFNDSFTTSNDMYFSVRDFDLFVFPNSGDLQFYSIALLKCAALFDNATGSRRNATLVGDLLQLTCNIEYKNEIDAHSNIPMNRPILQCETVDFPNSYYLQNLPIRIVSTNPIGKCTLIAGNRGFALYFPMQNRWNLFENKDDEEEFLVICPPCWHKDFVFIPVHNSEGHLNIRLYYSLFPLSTQSGESSCLAECPLDKRVVCLSFCNEHLFAIDANGNLLIYKFHQLPKEFSNTEDQFSICLKAQISLEREAAIHDAIVINNFHVTKHNLDAEVLYCLWILECGVLKLIRVRHCSNELISVVHSVHTIDEHVYWFAIEGELLFLFKGKSVAIYFLNDKTFLRKTSINSEPNEVCSRSSELKDIHSEENTINESLPDNRLNMNHALMTPKNEVINESHMTDNNSVASIKDSVEDTIVLATLPNTHTAMLDCNEPDITVTSNDFILVMHFATGLIVCGHGASQSTPNPFATDIPKSQSNNEDSLDVPLVSSYSMNVKLESVAGKIIKYFLTSRQQPIPSSFSFLPNSLELLLYQSFDAYLNDPLSLKGQQELIQTFSLLQSLSFTHLVILVARKTDSKYWRLLFETVRVDPLQIFLTTTKSNNFSLSLASLIVLRHFYDSKQLEDCCSQLTRALLDWFWENTTHAIEYLAELVRFSALNAIESGINDLLLEFSFNLATAGLFRRWKAIKSIISNYPMQDLIEKLNEKSVDSLHIGLRLDYELYVDRYQDSEMIGLIQNIVQKEHTSINTHLELVNWIDYDKLKGIVDELVELKAEFCAVPNLSQAIDEFLFINEAE